MWVCLSRCNEVVSNIESPRLPFFVIFSATTRWRSELNVSTLRNNQVNDMKQSLQQTDKTAAVSHRILQLHNTAKAYSDGTQRETFNVSQKEQNAEHFQVIFIAVILRRLNRQLKKGYGSTPRRVIGVGAHLPVYGRWARRWINHGVRNAWLVRRQTYGNLPSSSQNQIYTAW